MMTDIDPTGARGPRPVARFAAARLAAVLVALVAIAAPATGAADVDGRADWRMPRTAVGSGAAARADGATTPVGRAADEAADEKAGDETGDETGRAATSRSASPTDVDATRTGAAAGTVVVAEEDVAVGARRNGATPAATRGNAPPVLGGIAPQTLRVGRSWRLHVRARDPDGEAPTLLARGLPDAARLVAEGRGWYRLEWTPPAEAAGEVDLTLVAVDARDPRLRSERVLRLRVRDDARPAPDAGAPAGASPASPGLADRSSPVDPGSGDTADDIVATKGASPSPAPPPPLRAPRLAPLASQIVSAGRTVAFRVAATLDDDADRAPLLQIDRLPRHASFDENPDGSRSFYWPTGDRDQGEHRFRITALHPDDAALASRVDLLVIVGDPSRAVTVPLGERIVGGPALPALDVDPPAAASADDEPFLPQAGVDGSDDVVTGPGGADDSGDVYGSLDLPEPDDADFESFEEGYLDDDDGMPLGPDGLPLEP